MKSIAILTVYVSAAFAHILPVGHVYGLGGEGIYGIRQSYDGQKSASQLDEGYYANNGAWLSSPSVQAATGGSFDLSQYYKSQKAGSEIEKSYYDSMPNSWSSGSLQDINQYYNSKKSSSATDQGFYASGAADYLSLAPSYLHNGIQVVPPTLEGGNAYEVNQYYNSKKKASEVDHSYHENTVSNNANLWPSNARVLGNGNSYDVNQLYNAKNSASNLEQSYNGNEVITNPNRIPIVLPTFQDGSAFDLTQYYNSKQGASAIDQSYYDNTAVNMWPYNSKDMVGGPVVLDANAFDIRQHYSSQKAASDNSAPYGLAASTPVWTSRRVISPVRSIMWSKPQTYPFLNSPAESQRVVSENFRDSESESSNDQSSYLNNFAATNQGIISESAGSQSSSSNRDSDFSYDFSDISKDGYPSSVGPFVYTRPRL